MKKNYMKLAGGMVLALGLTLLGGCGKSVTSDKIIDKYAGLCTLGEYKGVEYEYTETEVTDDMVQSRIDSLLSSKATTNNVTSGVTEYGDTVNIDFAGTIDGVAFDGGTYEGYDVQIGSGYLLFDSDLEGHEVGESFDLDVTFPEDYGVEELNGQTAVFNITINYIEETIMPEYTDEFVAENTEQKTIAEYEQAVRDELIEQYAESDENYNKSAVAMTVVDNATINEFPQQELEQLVDRTVANVQAEADSYGYSLDTYIAARYGISTEDSFREYVSEMAQDYLSEKIVMCAIAKAEGITVSKDDAKAYKSEMMERAGYTDEAEFDKIYDDEDLMYYTIADKVVDFLLANGVASSTDATAE